MKYTILRPPSWPPLWAIRREFASTDGLGCVRYPRRRRQAVSAESRASREARCQGLRRCFERREDRDDRRSMICLPLRVPGAPGGSISALFSRFQSVAGGSFLRARRLDALGQGRGEADVGARSGAEPRRNQGGPCWRRDSVGGASLFSAAASLVQRDARADTPLAIGYCSRPCRAAVLPS